MLAFTNILIKTNCKYIFTRKHKLMPFDEMILNERSNFENDPQMNLRFLTLINISFERDQVQSQDRAEHKFEEDKLKELIDNILDNINKFRNILDSKETYFFEIPALTSQWSQVQSKESNGQGQQDRAQIDVVVSSNRQS